MLPESQEPRTSAGRTALIGEICEILAGKGHPVLSKQAIANLVSDGMPAAVRGRFDVDACTSWYIARLRTSTKRKETETGEGQTISFDTELTRLTKAKADNEEMTAAERNGTVIHIRDYEMEVSKWAQVTKSNLLNLPGRLAQRMFDLTAGEQKALIVAAAKAAMIDTTKIHVVGELPTPSRKRRQAKA